MSSSNNGGATGADMSGKSKSTASPTQSNDHNSSNAVATATNATSGNSAADVGQPMTTATTAAAATAAARDDNNDDGAAAAAPSVVVDLTKDLWQNILLNVRDATASEPSETNLLVVGASGSGKTTLLQRLSGSSSSSSVSGRGAATSRKLKPTTALEYSFMRRSDRATATASTTQQQQQQSASQQQQQIAHFWELAHGMDMAQLSEVVLTPENVHAVCVAVVVDAAPRGVAVAWQVATYWLRRIDQRVAEVMAKMRAKNSNTPDKLLARAKRVIGATHPDLPRMRLSGVPTVLVVNKMDAFAGDTARLRTLVRAFRFLAHVYGAYVVFTSESDVHRWRALMLHVLFQAPFDARYVQFDAERGAVLLTPDKESFADIGDAGTPAGGGAATRATASSSGADTDLDRWRVLCDATFPPTLLPCHEGNDAGDGDGAVPSSPSSAQDKAFLTRLYDMSEDGFGEPTIDALRRQMDEELEQYRRTAKLREAKA